MNKTLAISIAVLFSVASATHAQDARRRKKLIVKPSANYIVRAMRRLQGRGECSIRARWQTPEGKWTAETQDKIFFCEGPRDQWSEIIGVVTVPEGAGKLVLLLTVKGQESAGDVAWYDDVEVFRID